MVPGEYLSDDELQNLTDYSRAAERANWLKERGIPHRLRIAG